MSPPTRTCGARSRWRALLAALALLVLAGGCGGAAAAAAAAAPTGGTLVSCGGRRLLQTTGTAAPQPSDGGTGTVIETVEVDVVSQECVMNMNTFYEVVPERGVVQVQAPQDGLQPTAIKCCAACHDLGDACTAFQWCGQEGGCPVPGNASSSFPYQGCQLLDLRGFLATSVNTGELKVAGANVPFTAGSPLFFSVPKLSGYDVEIGRNFGGKFNYTCPGSEFNSSCVLLGDSARELGAACNADPVCLAFTFWPKGAPWSNGSAFGVLKGGEGVQLSSADTELNPEAAMYIKLNPLDAGLDGAGGGTGATGDADAALPDTDDGGGVAAGAAAEEGGGGTSTSTIVIAVVCSVVGAAVLAAVAAALLILRHRRAKAAVVDGRKAAPGGPAPHGSEEEGLSGPDASGGSSPAAGAAARAAAANGGASTVSEHSHDSELAAAAAAAAGGAALGAPKSAPAGRTGSPPSVLVHPVGGGGGSGPPAFSPFMVLSPHQLANGSGASELVVVEASRSSSDGSAALAAWQQQQYAAAAAAAAAGQHHAPPPAWQQPQLELALEVAPAPGALGAAPPGPLVVQVERAAPLGSGRGELPPSLGQAATARELLEVFARMYSQRPAVDLNLVAQMLDQEADPSAVAAAERADEEQLRQVDVEAARQRAASRARSPPVSNGSTGLSAAWAEASAAAAAAGAAATGAAAAAGAPGAAAQGPAPVPGSAALDQQQSLLPGMISPAASLVPTPAVEWTLQPEEVEICKRPDGSYWQLGTGAFGTCYKGLYHGRQLVAVKVLHRVEDRRRGEEFQREVALLKTLRDRNIVQFIGACLDGPTPMLVTEFMEFGDLWRALPLKNPAGQRIFAWHKRGRRVLFDVAKGLYYLHQRRIVHLDLKSANILLSRHGTAKICDIGMARVLGNKEYLSMLSGMGTFAWSAPEVLSGRRCTEKVDLYSFGVVIWEVCTGDVPVRGEMRALTAADCPQEIVDLYERCTAEAPEARPTAAELLQVLAEYL